MPRPRLPRYAAATAGVAVAAVVRWLLDPIVGDSLPYFTFFLVTLVASWYTGLGPALLTVGLGALIGTIGFVPPRGSLAIDDPRTLFVLFLYLTVGPLFALFGESVLAARRRATASAAEAARRADELAASERRFRALATHAPVGIFETDAAGSCLFVNERWCRITGLTPDEAAGGGWERALHPDDRDRVRADWYAAATAGKEFAGEYRFRTPEGRTVWVRGNAVALRDDAGAVTGHLGTVVDVTEERLAADAVRESERRLRALGDNLPDGAVYQAGVGPDGRRRFLYVSAGVERLFGVTPAEVTADATTLDRLIHPDDLPRLAAAEVAAGRGVAAFDCEFRSYTRGGGLRWVHCRSAPRPLPTGEIVWEGIILDVTDRRRAEEERARFAFLVENTTDFIGICDLERVPVYVNPAGLRLVGLADLAEARRHRVEDFFFPEDRAFVAGNLLPRVLRDGHAEAELRFRHFGTGAGVWVAYSALTLRDDGGRPVGFATVSRDVTDRKQAEEALRDADRRKDEFLATLAHELRNPLAPLRSGLLILRLARGDAGTAENTLAMMDRQFGHLVRLIDDLLDVSRITRGKLLVHRERVTLAGVLDAAVESARATIEAGGHRLTVDLPPEPVWLNADPVRLTQVFANLLNNAAKYTDPGGAITLSARCEGDRVAVSVRDTGIGIAPEDLPRLFDMFSQAAPALDRAQGGLGIGLSLVKGLVEMHGGTVEARSAGRGAGSEFVVRLPTAEPPGH